MVCLSASSRVFMLLSCIGQRSLSNSGVLEGLLNLLDSLLSPLQQPLAAAQRRTEGEHCDLGHASPLGKMKPGLSPQLGDTNSIHPSFISHERTEDVGKGGLVVTALVLKS